jgi:hypothetical protein
MDFHSYVSLLEGSFHSSTLIYVYVVESFLFPCSFQELGTLTN